MTLFTFFVFLLAFCMRLGWRSQDWLLLTVLFRFDHPNLVLRSGQLLRFFAV